MQVSIENKEGLKRLVTVTVPAEDVKKAYEKSFRDVAKKARIDGFRKGHIPAKILEAQFGSQIISEAYDDLINATLFKALEENKVEFVGRPEIDLAKASFDKSKELTYNATVEVENHIELKPFEELNVQKIKAEVTEADIDKMIENLRQQQAQWQVKDDTAVADGMMAKIDFTGRTGGEEFEGGKATDFSLVIGRTQMIPGFSEQIVGHKAGDKFTIQVKFPDDYHAENLKGKDAEFDIVVNSVSESVKPEVNEDFVKLFGVKDGTIETFRKDLRKNMERELSRGVDTLTRDNLFKALGEQYGDFDVPSLYVNMEIRRLRDNMLNRMRSYGMKVNKLPDNLVSDDKFKDEALKSARLGVILRAIADKSGIKEASKEFVEKHLNLIADAYEDPEEVKKQIRGDKEQFENVKNIAYEDEIVAHVMAKASKGDKQMSFDEIITNRQ